MYIAMNRFKVRLADRETFRDRWLKREVLLGAMPGFIAFHLLQGPDRTDYALFASHTVWRSKADFDAWTQSDAFRIAHARTDGASQYLLDRPELECFEVLQEVLGPAVSRAA